MNSFNALYHNIEQIKETKGERNNFPRAGFCLFSGRIN